MLESKEAKEKLEEIREVERERRRKGKERTNINTLEMQDLRWRTYGKGRKNFCKIYTSIYENMAKKVKGNTFLDVGCGEAGLIWKLIEYNKCKELIGIDIAPTRIWWNILEVKRRNLTNRVFFLVSFGEDLVFDDEYFDCVSCTHTLEHTTEPRKIIDEIMRVLKKGGSAIFGVPHEKPSHNPVNVPDHYHLWTKEEALKLFKNLNIKLVETIEPTIIVEVIK